jgi:hypothetical protein
VVQQQQQQQMVMMEMQQQQLGLGLQHARMHVMQQQQQVSQRAYAQRSHAVGMARLRTAAPCMRVTIQAGVFRAC